jgi:hypothetical protein
VENHGISVRVAVKVGKINEGLVAVYTALLGRFVNQ